ncbi:MAG: MATE family efflux transporter [Proteobacteria bacterium]|nr:MATE family efflux transporter [Pseudomonadota bacterium]
MIRAAPVRTPTVLTPTVRSAYETTIAVLLRLALPLLLELSLGVAAGVLGTVLAGQMADASAAAFALAMQFFQTAFLLFRVVGAGISVVLSQRLGYQDPIAAEVAARTALVASFVMGLLAAFVLWFGSDQLLIQFQVPEEVRLQARPLMQWLAPCVLLDALVVAMASVMRAHLFAVQSLRVMIVMHGLHWLMAWLLMEGGFGLSGFAMASMLSRLLSLVLLTRCWERYLGIEHIWLTTPTLDRAACCAILRIGLPGAAENGVWRLGFMASIAAASQLGTGSLATQAYVLQFNTVILLAGFAMGLAVEILVGRLVGEGHLKRAHALVRRVTWAGLLVAGSVSIVVALSGPWLVPLLTQDLSIRSEAIRLLWISVLLETGRSFNLVLLGSLRAVGDTRYPLYSGIPSVLLLLAGGSWLLGVHWAWGLAGIWLAYAADEWARGLLLWRRWLTLQWLPAAQQVIRRMRAEKKRGL